MLSELHLRDVGPAPALDVEFAERLNIFTGDNGLGKTFLLDCAWSALTGMFRVFPQPSGNGSGKPQIRGRISSANWTTGNTDFSADFIRSAQMWTWSGDSELKECLVLYSTVDGDYAIHDPARSNSLERVMRNGTRKVLLSFQGGESSSSFYFDREQVWDGLKDRERDTVYCNGLIDDWNRWELMHKADENRDDRENAYLILSSVLKTLSNPDEPLEPGPSRHLSLRDVRDIPTIRTIYGDIPVTLASAGVKRIISLSYLLVWTWVEHVRATQLLGKETASRLVLLMDEAELHLHPKWQRSIMPALLKVAKALSARIETQLLVTTHSPLVLASIEPEFDKERDRLFLFDIDKVKGQVELQELPWTKHGDATNWLTSPIFGLAQARSREAETAIEAAEAFMRGDFDALPEGLKTKEEIHAVLCRVVAGHDEFWPRWIVQECEVAR